MDIKHLLSLNPLEPAYADARPRAVHRHAPKGSIPFPGGRCEIGHPGKGFAFDNEGPRHSVWLQPFALSSALVTAGEWLGFMSDGGYRRPEFWLSDGWAWVTANRVEAPLYWRECEDRWSVFTLAGARAVEDAEPVVTDADEV